LKTALTLILPLLFFAGCHTDDNQFDRFVGTQKFGIGQVSSQIVIVLNQDGTTLSGGVTPPGSAIVEPISNGTITGTDVQFDRRADTITFRYNATLNGGELRGTFGPLGCIQPSSGEPCLTDSNGSFTAHN
jgi:hypothetical protein